MKSLKALDCLRPDGALSPRYEPRGVTRHPVASLAATDPGRDSVGTQLLDLRSGLTEILFGLGILPRAKQNQAEWQRLKPHLPCHSVDESDAELAAGLQIALRRRGWQLETVDALIAVIALKKRVAVDDRQRLRRDPRPAARELD